jgi:hypothetical protein
VNAADAAARYKRMADMTWAWGIRPLALQCHVARAVMLDEYGNDQTRALAALDEAVSELGEDVVLARARAKIHWRHDDHAGAIAILRRIADVVGRDNPIERAYALREAAISAAKTDDWPQAEVWFGEAQAAASAAKIEDMHVMAIGLGADAAVAALKSGQTARALKGLSDTLVALSGLDPAASLRAAYCHRVARHTVLWAESEIEGEAKTIDGQPIAMLPGTCSNPEPPAAIRDLPLGPLDLAWYMLAEAEIASGVDVGIFASLRERLGDGPILIYEVNLRHRWLIVDVIKTEPAGFAKHLQPYLEGMAFLRTEGAALRATFNVFSPPRGEVPALAPAALTETAVEALAIDAILSFGLSAVFTNRSEVLAALEQSLQGAFEGRYPGRAVFEHWRGAEVPLGALDTMIANGIALLRKGGHVEPNILWGIGLRAFEKIGQSGFRIQLVPVIATWLRAQWKRIVAEESFRLNRPLQTVPEIEGALTKSTDDEPFVASLLLATADAVGAPLGVAYRDRLKAIARGMNPDQGQKDSVTQSSSLPAEES